MRGLIAIVFFALALPLCSLAQSNYTPGYVINLKGDTLHGYIDFREWYINPSAIDFKNLASDKDAQKLTPNEIKLFNIEDLETYQVYKGRISMDRIDPDHIPSGRSTNYKTEPVFLKILQKGGNLVLYSYVDDIRPRFYIRETSDTTITELTYRIYKANDIPSGTVKTINENTYMRQLYLLAQKYNALTDTLQIDIEHMAYSEPDILKIVSKINKITETENPGKRVINHKTRFFVGAAMQVTTTVPYGSNQDTRFGNHTSVLPMATLGWDFPLNPDIGKLLFKLEFSLAANNYSSVYHNNSSPSNITYSYDAVAFAFEPQIVYNFYDTEKLKIFAGGGVAVSFYNYSSQTFKDANGSSVAGPTNPFAFDSIKLPLILKAGFWCDKNYQVYLDFITPSSSSTYAPDRLSFSSLQIGLNYEF
ncbi:MAG TPA: hypothetical protein VFE54_11175 [Mucilaginibacter sp.]|nr:hypothetical protein [Mucilaginibacter sp.]